VEITFVCNDGLMHVIIGKVTFTLNVHIMLNCRLKLGVD
jgi:hypothetical protein